MQSILHVMFCFWNDALSIVFFLLVLEKVWNYFGLLADIMQTLDYDYEG